MLPCVLLVVCGGRGSSWVHKDQRGGGCRGLSVEHAAHVRLLVNMVAVPSAILQVHRSPEHYVGLLGVLRSQLEPRLLGMSVQAVFHELHQHGVLGRLVQLGPKLEGARVVLGSFSGVLRREKTIVDIVGVSDPSLFFIGRKGAVSLDPHVSEALGETIGEVLLHIGDREQGGKQGPDRHAGNCLLNLLFSRICKLDIPIWGQALHPSRASVSFQPGHEGGQERLELRLGDGTRLPLLGGLAELASDLGHAL
mmetsp:Transcript_42227/g.92061  ORF Transcript_42227/g.92061 Transcript_42227/m.92061 type:complete len:252 (-) Transcript_42227:496-1251(-)